MNIDISKIEHLKPENVTPEMATNAIQLLMKSFPRDWDRIVSDAGKTDENWLEIASCLERIGIMACLMAEYIEARRGGYCGDHKLHTTAARMVEKKHVKIRRALGFTIPNSGILSL